MGKIACGVCDTAGKVKKYIELKVELLVFDFLTSIFNNN